MTINYLLLYTGEYIQKLHLTGEFLLDTEQNVHTLQGYWPDWKQVWKD